MAINIIELTYISGKKTLINFNLVTSTFRMMDNKSGQYVTRINFDGGQYTIVLESQQYIQGLLTNVLRFTNVQSGKSILINPDLIINTYSLIEEKTQKPATKVVFKDSTYQIIEEDHDTLLVYIEDHKNGYIQSNDWNDIELPGITKKEPRKRLNKISGIIY